MELSARDSAGRRHGVELPYVIGLTGNIACGKSTVLAMLRDLGAETIDADIVAHQVMEPGGAVYKKVVSAFGPGILDPGGRVDRRQLGELVFSQPSELERLERIVHPVVKSVVEAQLQQSGAKVTVVDAIKLLESSMGAHCDTIWVVTCRREQQLERLVRTRGMSEEEARRRIEVQGPQRQKVARADVAIDNSGTVEHTRRQVEAAWQKVLEGIQKGQAQLNRG